MAVSSGSLGGDDSSKLDALIKSLSENTDTLESLGRILSKVQDMSQSSSKTGTDKPSDILKNLEKILSKSDIQTARSKAVKSQADADKLAQNTFRASETIISEVLSRLGGTSFYPVLSAFRVARESVSLATGTPQSELQVTDMLKFVNDSTVELIGNIFTGFSNNAKNLQSTIDALNNSIDRTALDLQDEITIRESLMPVTSSIKKELETLKDLSPGDISKLDIQEMDKFANYIKALSSIGEATDEQKNLLLEFENALTNLEPALRSALNVSNKDTLNNLLENISLESSEFKKSGPALKQKLVGERESETEITASTIQSARTVAGLAGLAIPISFITSSVTSLTRATQNFTSQLGTVITSVASDPGGNKTLQSLTAPIKGATEFTGSAATLAGTIIGSLTPLGPIIGGPVGAFVGKALSDTLLGPLNFSVDLLVSINDSVTQIADDLVGFSPEVTGAVISREISILQDDFRRAAQIGPEIARITEAQTRLQLASRQAFDNIVEVTEPYLVSILNILTAISVSSEFSLNFLQGMLQAFPQLQAVLTFIKGAAIGINLSVDQIAQQLGTDDPFELAAIANQQAGVLFSQNPGANVQLRP